MIGSQISRIIQTDNSICNLQNMYLYFGAGFPCATQGSCVNDPSSERICFSENVTLGKVEACGSVNIY